MKKPWHSNYQGHEDAIQVYKEHLSEWQSFENKLIKGQLLFLTKNK
jgi:hypothetical protein